MASEAAKCSKLVKSILRKAFPETKFSVRSSYFANGNEVRISWNLGPTTSKVEKLVSKFQYGHFDGMVDMYEMSNVREDIPQVKFVMYQREHKSQEEIANERLKWGDPDRKDLWATEDTLYHKMLRDLAQAVGAEYVGVNTRLESMYLSDLSYRIFSKTDLPNGYHGIKRNEAIRAGLQEEFYIMY